MLWEYEYIRKSIHTEKLIVVIESGDKPKYILELSDNYKKAYKLDVDEIAYELYSAGFSDWEATKNLTVGP